MLNVCVPRPNGLACAEREPGAALPADAVWIDLREPTPEEEQFVENTLGIDVPTREEMRESEGAKRLTNRYTDPLPFRRFIAYAARHTSVAASGAMVLAGLLEAIVNRIADVLEKVGGDVDAISSKIFFRSYDTSAPLDFRHVLERVGQSGDLVSKASESLVSLTRLLGFVQQSDNTHVTQDSRTRYRTLSRDVLAMTDHSNFLSTKAQFLLDATLGR